MASQREINDLLLKIVQMQAAQGPLPSAQQNSVMSQNMLGAPKVEPYQFQGQPGESDPRGPSPVMRVLDLLSRGVYASLNPIKERLEQPSGQAAIEAIKSGEGLGAAVSELRDDRNPVEWIRDSITEGREAIREGVTGRAKTTGRDVLETFGMEPGLKRAGAGLAIDIVSDPLTYVGVGLTKHLGTGAKKSLEALGQVEEGTAAGARELSTQLGQRAAQSASDAGEATVRVPQAGAPAPAKGDPPRIFQAGPALGTQNLSVPQLPVGSTTISPPTSQSFSVREMLDDTLDPTTPGARELIESQKELTTTMQSQEELIDFLRAQHHFTSGPQKSLIHEQLTKLQQGITPAAALERAGLRPADIPKLTKPQTEAINNVFHNDVLPTRSGQWKAGRKNITKQLQALTAKGLVTIPDTGVPALTTKGRQWIAHYRGEVIPKAEAKEFPRINLSNQRKTAAVQIAGNFLKSNKFAEINEIGQARKLYGRIHDWVAKNVPPKAQPSVKLHMLRVAEDEVLKAGRRLVDKEGNTVRLSDVIQTAGGSKANMKELADKFASGEAIQAAENVKAANAPVIAQDIIDPVVKSGEQVAASVASKGLSTSRTVEVGTPIARELARIAQQAGASSKESQTAKEFIMDLFNPSRDSLYSAVEQEARNLMRQSTTGIVDANMIDRISKHTYRHLEANPRTLGRMARQTKVVEAIMTRIATNWNAKDLWPFAKEHIDTARNIPAAFERYMAPIIRQTTKTQRHSAFRITQGKAVAGTAEEQQLADRFGTLIEEMLGVHGARNGESVIFRGGVTMDELNHHLPSHLKFVDKDGVDAVGRRFDYGKGNWMHSWKEWESKEPAEALYSLTRALQLVTRKNAMWDDAASRFGLPYKSGEFSATVDVPRLKGFYFPPDLATQINSVWKRLETDKFNRGNQFWQLFDKTQRMWKSGVTIYSPSHHVRNLNGDIYLNWLDGVMNPTSYTIAAKAMWAHRGKYKDMESIKNIMDPKLKEMATKARPGDRLFSTKFGHKITAEQFYEAAESQGFLLKAPLLEDLGQTTVDAAEMTGTFGNKFSPFGGRVHNAAARTSEMRDHYARLAHFAHLLRKSKHKNLRDAIEEAGRRVRKFHPDGSDLTGFEQTVMRRAIPFYSWLRKATPLVLEGMAMRPHVTVAFPKVMANMQELTGIESQGPGDPFPVDQMFPEWIREKGIGPTIAPDSSIANIGRQQTWRGDTPGYVVVNPTNPFIDQIMELSNPYKTLKSGATPAARIPLELVTEHTALGIPLDEVQGGTAGHLAQQFPAAGITTRITGQTRPHEPWHHEQLLNWLATGGVVTGTGPYEQQASFEIQEMLGQMAREDRKSRRGVG